MLMGRVNNAFQKKLRYVGGIRLQNKKRKKWKQPLNGKKSIQRALEGLTTGDDIICLQKFLIRCFLNRKGNVSYALFFLIT